MSDPITTLATILGQRLGAIVAAIPRVVSATVLTDLAPPGDTQVSLDTGAPRVPARSLGPLYAAQTRVAVLQYPPRGLLILGPIDASAGDVVYNALATNTFAVGDVTITPVANTPTSIAVTGLNLVAGKTYRGFATARTTVIGTVVLGVAVTAVTEAGLTVWVTRTDTTNTIVDWLVIAEDS